MSPAELPSSRPGAPATGLDWHRLRRSLLRQTLIVGSLCGAIALLLTAIDGRGFGVKLLYSLCIGVTCTFIVQGTRLVAQALSNFLRRRQGLPPTVWGQSWRGVVPGALLAVVLGPALGFALADQITGLQSASILQLSSPSTRITLAVTLVATVVASGTLGILEHLSAVREQAQAAQRQAAESQLRLLQSQLQPHMLFNTLANLRVLIGLDPARAQAMLDRLIAYLRATLQASRAQAHPLATEFERLADYLALMGVRMGARLRVELDLPEALRRVPVPPLLLQPLVENAIQHGLEPHVQGGLLRVAARAQGGQLLLSVRDTGAGLAEAAVRGSGGTGFGLGQVRERLNTLYGSQAGLSLDPARDEAGGTLAEIHLPLQPQARSDEPASSPTQPA